MSTYRLEIKTESPNPATQNPAGVKVFEMVLSEEQFAIVMTATIKALNDRGGWRDNWPAGAGTVAPDEHSPR